MKNNKILWKIVIVILAISAGVISYKMGLKLGKNQVAEVSLTTEETTEEITEEMTTEEILEKKPELSQIKNICELSAVECEFTNVAKSVKEPGTGIQHWGEKQRKFWIKYKAKVRISYDLNKIEMHQNEDTITISLPEPSVTSSIVNNSWNEGSYVIEKDRIIQKNPITADDQTSAVKESCNKIEDEVKNNSTKETEMIKESEIDDYLDLNLR